MLHKTFDNKGFVFLTTSNELEEIKALKSPPKALPKAPRIRLQYLKGSKQKMAWAEQHGIDGRMWNLIEPKLPGYTYDGGFPTFSLEGLRQNGVIQ